jgi:uncharacterized RDD family membrane protein YckC
MAIDYSKPPGFIRRIACVVYDLLLLIAVLFFATLIVLPLNHAQAFDPDSRLFSVYLALVGCVFYSWFWTHGGQTLGMRAWKIRLVTNDGHSPDWSHALLRCVFGLLSWGLAGGGFLYILLNKKRLALHDIASNTLMVWHDPKRQDQNEAHQPTKN